MIPIDESQFPDADEGGFIGQEDAMTESDEEIKSLADALRERMKNGRLWGKSMDPNNSDHLVVAAYELGKFDSLMRDLEIVYGTGRNEPKGTLTAG